MDWERVVGRNVKRLRLERGLTQEEVAHRVGIVNSYFGEIERGRRHPTLAVLGRIADALDVQLEQLLQRDGSNPTNKHT